MEIIEGISPAFTITIILSVSFPTVYIVHEIQCQQDCSYFKTFPDNPTIA
jgi:hypothetical protein